jgi:PAS domain S-box-containing protein
MKRQPDPAKRSKPPLRADADLREALEFSRQLIASAHEGVIVYGPDLRYQVWNPFMERMTGVPAKDVLGKHPLQAFPFLRKAGVIAALERVLRGGKPFAGVPV